MVRILTKLRKYVKLLVSTICLILLLSACLSGPRGKSFLSNIAKGNTYTSEIVASLQNCDTATKESLTKGVWFLLFQVSKFSYKDFSVPFQKIFFVSSYERNPFYKLVSINAP